MRICLVPLKIETKKPSINLHRFKMLMDRIAKDKPDVVCLPECAFTGYLYDVDDLRRFAEPLHGPTLVEMAQIAKKHQVYLCFGWLELTARGVYDSAVLLDRQGRVLAVHRKIAEQPPFLVGTQVTSAETEFGKLGILICGDLFHEEVIAKIAPEVRLLLIPMARGFDGQSPDSERWQREERSAYAEAVKKVGVPAVLVNALEVETEEGSFGGALVVDAFGKVLEESPHGTDEILVYNIV